MDIKERAKELLLKNYARTGRRYIAPDRSRFHQDQWLWDSCFHAISCSELGLKDLAKNEIERLLKWQKDDGLIPHQIYKTKKRWWLDFERPLYKNEDNINHSSITNPPVMAQAAEAINDPEWIQKILPKLVKFYLYFAQKRDPDSDGLISVCLPTETGRDTSPDFNFCEPFNIIKFFFSLYKLEWQHKKSGWDMEKIWQKNLFNVEDVMFNCIWIEGLRIIGQHSLADKAEKAIYELCWDEKDKIFYNLDSQNKKIKRLTISGLFPLILDHIPAKMHQALVELHLTNPEEFWTAYPIPTVAKSDPSFDPNHGYYCNWRGPVWINMNWFIIKGLIKHGYREIAEEIADKTLKMVEKEGFREFYSPLTGRGLRFLTKGFGWSTLAITLPKIIEQK